MPEVRVNGVTLHYTETGSGDETVVFSHSYLVDHRHFAPQIERLAADYRVLAFDHRGHGGSEKPADGYSMEQIYRDALAFLEATRAAPCHFVGLSTGGFIGMRLGLRRPELLRSLVLMDTSADPEPTFYKIKYSALFWGLRLLGFGPVTQPALQALFGPKFLRDPARAAEVERWRLIIRQNDVRALIRFGHAIFSRAGVYEQLGRIRTPTLVVVGEQDQATPVSRARRIADAVPGAQLEIIPNAGHLCTVEEPEAVNRVLGDFLSQHHASGD